jgi:hypothetical protein
VQALVQPLGLCEPFVRRPAVAKAKNPANYLVSTIVAGRRDGLIAPLEALVATEEDRLKEAICLLTLT